MQQREHVRALLQWIVLGALVGVACGVLCAVFLALLDLATQWRIHHEAVVFALPVAGLGIGLGYERFGRQISGGNNLVIDTIHDEGPQIPLRMAPMVLIGTVLTHLFGGSAGREGTAVQMGASVSDYLAHRLRLGKEQRRHVVAAGVAGGFGAVFGTPIAGLLFGLEFVVLGFLDYAALVPALTASIVGDLTTRALGIEHTLYPKVPELTLTPLLLGKWFLFAAAIAAVSGLFIELTHFLKKQADKRLARLPLRLFCGGLAVVLLWQLWGTSDYLGLGVPTILAAFDDVDLSRAAFFAKLVFTALTLGAGFLGGEVTPLFFMGATLGNVLARLLDLPVALGAGVGLAAMFATASNTPVALSMMAIELLGVGVLPHIVIVCVLAYIMSGHRSIYSAQRLRRGKSGVEFDKPTALRELTKR